MDRYNNDADSESILQMESNTNAGMNNTMKINLESEEESDDDDSHKITAVESVDNLSVFEEDIVINKELVNEDVHKVGEIM